MRFLAVILLSAIACGNAFGWGCEGHQIIALITSRHLTPEARTAVYRLLKEHPIDPALRRFCQPVATDPMLDAATWADDMKRVAKNDVWHYVDIPRDVEHANLMKYCAPVGRAKDRPGCILTALQAEVNILRDRNRPAAERATALRYVIHLIGDMHTPLHTDDDEGGNCTSVILFDNPRRANLHGAWDYGIIQHYLKQNDQTPEQMAAQLDARYRAEGQNWLHERMDFAAWLWESHRVAAQVTYGKLSQKVPVENAVDEASCTAEREKTAALNIRIDEKYTAAAMPVIEQQLAKAGYRLADVLNSAF